MRSEIPEIVHLWRPRELGWGTTIAWPLEGCSQRHQTCVEGQSAVRCSPALEVAVSGISRSRCAAQPSSLPCRGRDLPGTQDRRSGSSPAEPGGLQSLPVGHLGDARMVEATSDFMASLALRREVLSATTHSLPPASARMYRNAEFSTKT